MWSCSNVSKPEGNLNVPLQPEFTETFQLSKYEIKTLASLSTEKTLNEVSFHCISSPSYIVIALDKKLSIFKEDSFELFGEFSFDTHCHWINLSQDLCLLLVVESPGTVHLLHIPSCKTVWSYNFEENGNQCTVQNVFCSDSSGSLYIYVYTEEGTLYEFSKIDTSALYKAMEEEEGDISNIFKNVHVETVELLEKFPFYSAYSSFETFSHIFPIGLNVVASLSDVSISDYYTIEDMVDGDFAFDEEWLSTDKKFFDFYDLSAFDKMLKTACTRNGRYIVCLSEKHVLLTFCAFTLVNLDEWGDGDIVDFALQNTVDHDDLSKADYQIGILRKLKDGHIFEIRKFPSFDLSHKIQLSEFAKLAESKPNQDSWYIMEGDTVYSGIKQSSFLKIKSVSESHPEARLMSLLNRGKFKEAEKYAKMCNLDSEIIFKTKINLMIKDYLDDPSVAISNNDLDYLCKEVENCLDKIKDLEFVRSCIMSFAPEMEFMKKFLPCINKWLAAHNDMEGIQDLICQINRNENKFITYNVLPDSILANLTLKEFLKKEMLHYMISELISGCLATALVVWQRHKDELLNDLSAEEVGDILHAVSDIPSQHLIPFLEDDFLPYVLSKIPESVDLIADWIIGQIHLLELVEKESWPETGDKLASVLLGLIQNLLKRSGRGAISFSTSISLASIHKKFTNSDSRIGCLYELSKNLKLLVKLKEKFNCKISLTTFQDSKMDVIFAVLDRINIKYIVEAISEFARPYSLENGLDLDQCLEIYVKNTLQNSYFTWWSWDEEPWEEHLSLVLECIHDSARWLTAALMLVSRATVPWSDRVKSIVERGLNSNLPSENEFKQQAKQVSLKEVLVKYDFKNFPMNNCMEHIYTLVNYIFKQNRESALEDAKKVMLSCSDSLDNRINFRFLQSLLNQNKIDEFFDLFSSIPVNTAVECSCSLLKFISFNLERSFLIHNYKKNMNTLLSAGIYLLEFLAAKKCTFDRTLLNAFGSMQKLQKEFNMDVTLSSVICKEKTSKIIQDEINSFLDKELVSQQVVQKEKKHISVSLRIFKINRLGDILGLDRAHSIALLITGCLQKNMYDLVIDLCGELISSYPTQSSETLVQVVNHFYKNFQNVKNMSFEAIVGTIRHLSNLAATYCPDSTIEECLYIVRLSTFFAVTNKISGPKSFLSPTFTADSYYKWKYCPLYSDEGFQLDVNLVVDFVLKLFPLFLRKSNNLEQAIDFRMTDAFTTIFEPLITHMQKRGHGIAALRTMFLFYHLQMEFLQNESSTWEAYSLIQKNIEDTVYQLIMRMIDSRRLDLEFCIALLTLFPTQEIQILQKLQKWCTKDLLCIMSLGEIGSEYCRLIGDTSESSEYDKIYRRAALLLKQKITPTSADIALKSPNSDNCWDVATEVILCPRVSLSTVLECCSAFDLVTDHVLVAFLNNLLMECEKYTMSNSKVQEDNIKQMLNQAKCVIGTISCEKLVVQNLESFLKKLGSYSYEVLQFLHEQIVSVSANVLSINSGYLESGIQLLDFLTVYERVSPPGPIEINHWISLHPIETKLPAVANKRLPFWPISHDKCFKIINPELTAETLTVWLRIAPLLKISPDDLAMIAIKNNAMKFLEKLPDKHFLLNQDNCFLGSMQTMLKNISNPEMAVTSVSWVANRMPPGANKVLSCMMAVMFSKDWCEACPRDRNALEIHSKLMMLYEHSQIERILHQYNLATDASLSYARKPVQLVEYCIEEFCHSSESSINVCKIAAEISKVVAINLTDIFFKYFHKWLSISSTTTNNLDEAYTIDLARNALFQDDNIDKNILRSINLLMGVSTINHNIFENFCVRVANMSSILRTRFIFCSVSIYGYETVADALQIPVDVSKKTLSLCLCSTELECLHLMYSLDVIENCNKVELIQRLLSDQYNNSKVLLLCVRLSLENNIWESHIWDIYFQKLVEMSMAECLQDILQTAQGQLVHMWHYKSFISAWNCIVSSYFKDDSGNAAVVIDKVYKVILSCPCATALDVESLWNDLKYFIKSVNEKILNNIETVTDVCSFMKALKTSREFLSS